MAVSGSQKTRIGASLHGVGKKLTITAKAELEVSPVKFVRGFIVNVNRMGLR